MEGETGKARVRALPRGLIGLCALAATLSVVSVGAASGATGGTERPARLAPAPLPQDLVPAGSLPGNEQVDFEVVLAPRDPSGITSLLSSQYSPGSSSFHHWLARGAFDADFGPLPSTVRATVSWLEGLGLEARAGGGFSVQASGTASAVSRGLGISLLRYHSARGAVFAGSRSPQVPS
ncbi:MAG: protease pro-enzyme activation domain-containing protein, partial [Acidimicrobiales bacterium]